MEDTNSFNIDIENSNSICMKCGGTGLDFNLKPCDCGTKPPEIPEMSDKDKYIPKIYQDLEPNTGYGQVIDIIPDVSLMSLINRICEDKNTQSMIIDLSNTTEGAYNIYYRILGRVIELNNGILPEGYRDSFMINKISVDDMDIMEDRVAKGNWKPIYIITDYKLNKFRDVLDNLKVLQFNRFLDKSYPLNFYHIKFKER